MIYKYGQLFTQKRQQGMALQKHLIIPIEKMQTKKNITELK